MTNDKTHVLSNIGFFFIHSLYNIKFFFIIIILFGKLLNEFRESRVFCTSYILRLRIYITFFFFNQDWENEAPSARVSTRTSGRLRWSLLCWWKVSVYVYLPGCHIKRRNSILALASFLFNIIQPGFKFPYVSCFDHFYMQVVPDSFASVGKAVFLLQVIICNFSMSFFNPKQTDLLYPLSPFPSKP